MMKCSEGWDNGCRDECANMNMKLMDHDERRKSNRKIAEGAVVKERAERRKEKDRNIALGIIAAMAVLAFLYFFVVSPTFITKPSLTKLPLSSPSDIGSEHVDWLLNEVGAYRLHSYLYLGELPVIESVITDQNRKFTTTVKDNYPTTVEGAANNPDIRFLMSGADFVTLYSASDVLAKAQEMRKSGLIKIEILKDEFTMAVKGYKAIYDSLPG
jgi:hypothetical protein